jgi:hypothetical protein
MNSATATYDERKLAATAPNNSTTRRVRTFGRRIAGARKELSRGYSRTGSAFVMLYPHAKRIEVSWGDGADHTGIPMSFTRDQGVQLAAEIHDLLDLLDEVDSQTTGASAAHDAKGR